MKALSSDQQESFEYLFKTNNPHVAKFKDYIAACIQDELDMVTASGTQELEMFRAAGAASVLQILDKHITF